MLRNILSSMILMTLAVFAAVRATPVETPVPDDETVEIRRPADAPPRIVSALSQMQGRWRFIKIVDDGQDTPLTVALTEEIIGNQLFYVRPDRRYLSSILLVDEKRGHCDLVNALENANDDANAPSCRLIPGIYRLEGDRMTICLNTKGPAHPTDFTAGAGSGRRLSILERVADKK